MKTAAEVDVAIEADLREAMRRAFELASQGEQFDAGALLLQVIEERERSTQ